jgi:hypothetical protein
MADGVEHLGGEGVKADEAMYVDDEHAFTGGTLERSTLHFKDESH